MTKILSGNTDPQSPRQKTL
ncbi:hypothetical protein Avbf_17944 [Armadillidium vulgare]|nr:hypothetical protein Avbf_17944 [Armadillidium vulgare]